MSMFCPDTEFDQSVGTFGGAQVLFCHTSRTSLSTDFAANYAGNTPVAVVSRSSLALNWIEGQWNEMAFDSLFAYNGSDNLLIEFRWDGANGAVITGVTSPAATPALLGDAVHSASGNLLSYRNVFRLHFQDPPPPDIQPDIRINGQDGPVTLRQGEILSATIDLQTGAGAGMPADWWVAALAPGGAWWYFDAYTVAWNPVISFTPSYQGALFNFAAPIDILTLDTRWLPPGTYALYFGVDTAMNGVLDSPPFLVYDSVTLNLVR